MGEHEESQTKQGTSSKKKRSDKQKRKKTTAKAKSVRHQGLLALQTKQPKLGGTNL